MVLTNGRRGRGVVLARGLLVLGLAGVAWASLIRPESLPEEVGLVPDKVLHAAGYAFLGALAVASRVRPIAALGLLASFGLLLELAQLAAGYRSFEWADLLADIVGVLVGINAVLIARGASSRRRGE